MVMVHHARGEFQKALEYCDQIRRAVNQPGRGVTPLILELAMLGRKEEAYVYVEQLHRRSEEDLKITVDSDLACCYAALGDMDKAFFYLDLCYQKHLGTIIYAIRYPLNMFFHKEERYWELLDKMGLKKYYENERNA